MVANASWQRLLWRVHHDEEGAVSLETVLIIGAIALPILIFLIDGGVAEGEKLFQSRGCKSCRVHRSKPPASCRMTAPLVQSGETPHMEKPSWAGWPYARACRGWRGWAFPAWH